MLEHVGDLRGSDARDGKRWKIVLREKVRTDGFVAVLSGAAKKLAEEKELVGVESVRGVSPKVAVVNSGELGDGNVVAGLFPGFADGGEARGFTGVGPTAGESPATVV